MTNSNPMVSIVVSAYTMERFHDLTELLESIHNQTYNHFETILVTERSTELYDNLKLHITEKKYANTYVLFNHGPWGLSPARNMGIKEAKGDIIAFTDDDAVALPDWLEKIVQTFNNHSVIGVTGSAFPLWEDESMKWFPEEFYWIISCTAWFTHKEVKKVRNAWGNNMAFKREAFDLGRTFGHNFGSIGENKKGNIGLTSDDTEFCLRLEHETGKYIVFNPDIKIWHKAYAFRLKTKYIQRLSYRHGLTKAIIKKYYYDKCDENILSSEQALLWQILLKLLPRTLIGFFNRPIKSWRVFSVTIVVLFYTAIGYIVGSLRNVKALETQ